MQAAVWGRATARAGWILVSSPLAQTAHPNASVASMGTKFLFRNFGLERVFAVVGGADASFHGRNHTRNIVTTQ
jgi:hypothetical protein